MYHSICLQFTGCLFAARQVKPAFGEASFWGSNLLGNSSFEEPTFLKVGLEAR